MYQFRKRSKPANALGPLDALKIHTAGGGRAVLDVDGLTENLLTRPKDREQWQLSHGDLVYGKTIGSGAFGVVFDGKHMGTAVAIKSILVQASHEYEPQKFEKEVDRIKREINILWELRQPNILCLYGGCFDDVVASGKVCLVTELCKGSLLRYITKKGRGADMPSHTDELILQFAAEVLAGLEFMHARGIIHRDLKPDNILVSMDDHAKIADFGLSKKLEDASNGHTANIGTPAYMAPECLFYDTSESSNYTYAVDMYSFGIILNCLWRRAPPYESSEFKTVLHLLRAVEEGWRPPLPLGCPEFVGNLMCWSWHAEPNERITASKALEYVNTSAEKEAEEAPYRADELYGSASTAVSNDVENGSNGEQQRSEMAAACNAQADPLWHNGDVDTTASGRF
jgi:serine/threonine protein kinase